MSIFRSKFLPLILSILVILPLGIFGNAEPAKAAASLYVSAQGSATTGETINVNIYVNTGGQSANAFDFVFTYPDSLFEGIRGTYSGSICTLPIVTPEPSGGSATVSCGRPSGFNGTGVVATIVLKADTAGTGNFGLSGCTVLANDGAGTDISGGCSGKTIAVNGPDQATPTPTGSPTAQPSVSILPTNTPKPATTPRAGTTPTGALTAATQQPGGPGTAVENPAEGEATPDPSLPDPQSLPSVSANPDDDEPLDTGTGERRTIAQAIQDLFGSLRDLGSIGSNLPGLIALLLAVIPALALGVAILFLIYRLYILERRRRRTLDRLFEMELSELASLEGKLDLLAEKGAKGREQYKEEFRLAKESILRQIRPDYNKPVDGEKKAAKPAEPPAEEKK